MFSIHSIDHHLINSLESSLSTEFGKFLALCKKNWVDNTYTYSEDVFDSGVSTE